jgi:hypothetical protein
MTSKKPRLPVALSSTGQTAPLLAWLERSGATGIDHLRFEMSPSLGSLGCFAGRDFAVGDVLFSVPWSCIVTYADTEHSPTVALIKEGVASPACVASCSSSSPPSSLMTAELLLWVFLIEQRAAAATSAAAPSSTYGPFVTSLDATSPSPLSWPSDLLHALEATNVATMATAKGTLEQQLELLDRVRRWGEAERKDPGALKVLRDVDLAALLWARGHYLARRYPAHFAGDVKGSSEGPPGVAREVGLENMGALVPLLDILNHSDSEDYLTFDVRDGFLRVLCNYPRKAGDELLSNYGLLSNERLLFAYGFAVENNPYDTVALKLMCRTVATGAAAWRAVVEAEEKERMKVRGPPSPTDWCSPIHAIVHIVYPRRNAGPDDHAERRVAVRPRLGHGLSGGPAVLPELPKWQGCCTRYVHISSLGP